jgi:ABC-2 type transport system ATP-binding protein
METVEELCDSIALINKSKKILSGSVKEIRTQFRTNTYRVEFTGNLLSFTNALWAGAEMIDKTSDGQHCSVKLKLLGGNTVNNLLSAVMPVCEINSIHEVVPSMSDIFIETVNKF